MSGLEIYRHLASIHPMMPTTHSSLAALAEVSVAIFQKSGELKTALPSRWARGELGMLVRSMNSYYSNLIEGHKTLPKDIEKALHSGTSGTPDEQRNQRLSIAHVKAEEAMRAKLEGDKEVDVFSKSFICWLHQEFYSHLPEEDRRVELGKGNFHPEPLEPGRTRSYNVSVGRHDPPDFSAVPEFLDEYARAYGSPQILATDRLVALAAAHHRLAWIHPFGDGNGRVARLQSQAAMIRAGIDGEGLWTLSRGLARSQQDYYRHLQNADAARLNDYDGRGARSEKHLGEFCLFFLTTILDQMGFMTGLVKPESLGSRIETYVFLYLTHLNSRTRERVSRLLRELCVKDEIARGHVAGLLGLSSTSAREVIRTTLELGLVTSDTEKGPLRITFPARVAEIYFPSLG